MSILFNNCFPYKSHKYFLIFLCRFTLTLSLYLHSTNKSSPIDQQLSTECYSHLVLLDGRCLESCPDGYFTQLYLKEITKSHHYRCSKCHYSCKSCTGPNDNECNQCYPDAQLNWKGHCHPKELVQEINALERWYTSITVVFLVLCFLVVSLVVYIVAPKHSKVSCFHGFTESNHEPKYENVPLRLNTRRNNLSKQSTSIEMGTENATGMSNNILKEENSEDDA